MEFRQKLSALRKKLRLTQEEMGERLGVRGNWISLLERGDKEPGDALIKHFELLEKMVEAGIFHADTKWSTSSLKREELQPVEIVSEAAVLREEPPVLPPIKQGPKMIPVVSWATAGQAADYDVIPEHWMAQVISDCPDPRAFSVFLEGDAMEGHYREGDRLTLMPSEEAYSGCLVVARFVEGGAVFRRLEASGGRIQLVALNERYPVTDHAPEEFSWIFPVWGRWTQTWKRRN